MSLDKAKITGEALALLNDSGLDGVSLRKVADRLDVKAPALYWYFKNKADLVDSMAERIVSSHFSDLQPRHKDQPWQDWLETTMRLFRSTLRSYKNGGIVVITAHLHIATTLTKLSEICTASLVDAGVPLMKAHIITTTAMHYTYAHVIREETIYTAKEVQFLMSPEYQKEYPVRAAVGQHMIAEGWNADKHYLEGLKQIINS